MAETSVPSPIEPEDVGSSPEAQGSLTFEERLQELEMLAERLKDGEVPLAEAVKLFERGMELARSLGTDLAKIERRIEIMINDPELNDGVPDLQPFSETECEQQDDEEQKKTLS